MSAASLGDGQRLGIGPLAAVGQRDDGHGCVTGEKARDYADPRRMASSHPNTPKKGRHPRGRRPSERQVQINR